tara:strand:- start:707 stop:811 length:105 start_codon:yes stop_codon:yes gene_type:complete
MEKEYIEAVYIPESVYEKMCCYLDCDDITLMGVS